jgi:hypothetical protein
VQGSPDINKTIAGQVRFTGLELETIQALQLAGRQY